MKHVMYTKRKRSAGWSEVDLPVRQRTQTGIPIHRGKQGSREK